MCTQVTANRAGDEFHVGNHYEAKPVGIPHGTTGPSDFVKIYTQSCIIRYVILVLYKYSWYFYNTCTHVRKTL